MFDRVLVQKGRTEYVPYEKTVNVIRPSTAEDLKKLSEIRDQVLDSVIGKVTSTDGRLSGVAYEDLRLRGRAVRMKFEYCGETFYKTFDDLDELRETDMLRKLCDGIRRWIADEVLCYSLTVGDLRLAPVGRG